MAIKNRKRAGAFVLILGTGLASLIIPVPKAVKAGSEADEAAAARHEYTEKDRCQIQLSFRQRTPLRPLKRNDRYRRVYRPQDLSDCRILRSLPSGESQAMERVCSL